MATRTEVQRVHQQRDITANSQKLTDLEGSIILQHILDLDSKGVPPRFCVVEDVANHILTERDSWRIGPRWAANFIKRQPEIRARFNHKYGYQRALYEDPELTQGWFVHVCSTITKYGILDADIYNFDQMGFMKGITSSAIVVISVERCSKLKVK